MSCVSISRPCLLTGLAQTWPAFEKWAYKNKNSDTLLSKFDNFKVKAYIDEEAP